MRENLRMGAYLRSDRKAIAADLRQSVAKVAAKFRESTGRSPGLAVVLVGEHPPSAAYVRSKIKATLEAGMESFAHHLPDTVSEARPVRTLVGFSPPICGTIPAVTRWFRSSRSITCSVQRRISLSRWMRICSDSSRLCSLAIRWLVQFARDRREKGMEQKIAGELMDAINSQGGAFKKKDDIYRMAQANKAFAHYRW